MIRILIDNEELDINPATTVTFKKAQELNGIQDRYSYSNNFTILNSAKNRRLLKINYLPNSKAISMTAGYDCDVVLNGCIFLKRQKVKVQKETAAGIAIFLLFNDNLFVSKSKEILLSQIDTGASYTKTPAELQDKNLAVNPQRAAAVSAQDQSGLIVVEESVMLLNLTDLIQRVFSQLGYSYYGDFMLDLDLVPYYVSQNVGKYGEDGSVIFDKSIRCYDFVVWVLKTFNGYIEVSDSAKNLGFFLWKNIEDKKKQFVDYSEFYSNFQEYSFEGGLAKVNTIEYSDSPDFYNSFFENNKSQVETAQYLKSDFGAGSLRFFDDQQIAEDGTIELREDGLESDPQTMNLYRFEDAPVSMRVYYEGQPLTILLYRAYSPSILEIWQKFHQAYCRNISLPTLGLFTFRYNPIFLANFKMSEIFFIKQLSTYWLPLEQNFTTEKGSVKIKALMIEKTRVDSPIVFDLNVSLDFYGSVTISDIFTLYSAANVSPASQMQIVSADLTKNAIFVNGVQVMALPFTADISASFDLQIDNIEAENVKSNSDILYQMVSEEGGTSNVGKINVAHNGRATFLSEFRSLPDVEYTYGRSNVDGFSRRLNYSAKITTPVNIADTFAPAIGDVETLAESLVQFKALQFDRASTVKCDLSIGFARYKCSNRGGGAKAQVNVTFLIYKNGVVFQTMYSQGAIDNKKKSDTTIEISNAAASKTFSVAAADTLAIQIFIKGVEEDRLGSGQMDGSVMVKNVIWKFHVTEQL